MDTLPIDFSYKILYSKYQAPELRAFNNWLGTTSGCEVHILLLTYYQQPELIPDPTTDI